MIFNCDMVEECWTHVEGRFVKWVSCPKSKLV